MNGVDRVTTAWWLGYWRAGEQLYWWTMCLSPTVDRAQVRAHVRDRVNRETWDRTVDPARSAAPVSSATVEAALVAAGAVPWSTVEPLLAAIAAAVPVQSDPTLVQEQESLARRQRSLEELTAMLPATDPTSRLEQAAALAADQLALRLREAKLKHAAVLDSVERAWTGPLTDQTTNSDLFRELGQRLLPPVLREYLACCDDPRDDPSTTVVVAPGPELGQVPWELMSVTGTERLVERTVLRGGISPATVADLALPPAPDAPEQPGLLLLDPAVRQRGSGAVPIYPGGVPAEWSDPDRADRRDSVVGRTWSIPDTAPLPARDAGGDRLGCTRAELADLLGSRTWGRFLFHGHVSSADRLSPTAAALVLHDDPAAREAPARTADGRALEEAGDTADLSARIWLHEPDRWPMPRRVAFIACQSDDAGYVEQTGLTLAAVNAGARVVVTTRWTMPTDSTAAVDGARPTTAVALAVDAALQADDPVTALRTWQLAELDAWRDATTPEQRRRHAPLLWSALVTYVLPDQLPRTSIDDPPASP